MDGAAFAADRGALLERADAVLRPVVRGALPEFGTPEWEQPIVEAASGVWLDLFSAEAPGSYPHRGLLDFRTSLGKALRKTSQPTDPPELAQIKRVTDWVATYAVNDATYSAAFANGHRQKRWVDRHDGDVRRIHREANGQTVRISGTFNVGGYKLRFPGDPVGPFHIWIECRCHVQPVGKGRRMTSRSAAIDDETITEDVIVDPEADAVEPPTHAGLAVRALSSGRVLMLQRALDDNDGGTWEFPGGSINEGETPDQGALREWSEEVGMPVPDGTPSGDWLTPDGVYAGFVLDVAEEFEIHERENVGDPEEGDIADQVPEALAWWMPGDLVNNPVVRPALQADLVDVVLPVLIPETVAEYDAPEEDIMTNTVTADAAAPVVDEEVVEAPVEEAPAPEEEQPDIDDQVEIPFHGVAAKLGALSGDGRRFNGEVRNRDLPLPFWLDDSSAHSPDVGTRRAGRLDHIWVDEAGLIKYDGVLEAGNPAAAEVVEGYVFGSLKSVSVDLGDLTMAFSETDTWNEQPVQDYSMIEIAGLSVVGIGAFREAYFALGTWADEEACADCDTSVVDREDAPLIAAALSAGVVTADETGLSADDVTELLDFFATAGIVDLTELDDAALAEYDALPYDQQDAWLQLNHPEAIVASGNAFVPGTHDGPGWITDPIPTERIRRYWVHGEGAAKIRWGIPGDFNRCRKQLAKYILNPDWLAGACANMHKEALGVWPGQEGGKNVASSVGVVAAGGPPALRPPRDWFEDPQLERATRITITPEGRVFGHLAEWGVCHIGIHGMCTEAPTSESGYAYYHTGLVETDGGDVEVGHLVHGLGHASTDPNVTAAAATAFYDRADAVYADVVVGEDAHGIWFSGALRPSVTDDLRREIRATGKLSGDWRRVRGALELIACVTVGVEGFQMAATHIAASGGVQVALVAAGIVQEAEAVLSSVLDTDELVRRAADEVERRVARRDAASRHRAVLEPAVTIAKTARASAARELLSAGREG